MIHGKNTDPLIAETAALLRRLPLTPRCEPIVRLLESGHFVRAMSAARDLVRATDPAERTPAEEAVCRLADVDYHGAARDAARELLSETPTITDPEDGLICAACGRGHHGLPCPHVMPAR